MDILPQHKKDFLKKKYWDDFFAKLKNSKDEYFEWYAKYKDIKHIFQFMFENKDTYILNIGCGKSLLSEEMYLDGYE